MIAQAALPRIPTASVPQSSSGVQSMGQEVPAICGMSMSIPPQITRGRSRRIGGRMRAILQKQGKATGASQPVLHFLEQRIRKRTGKRFVVQLRQADDPFSPFQEEQLPETVIADQLGR